MDKVAHFEIPADNLERARRFYSEIFGWTIKPYKDTDWYLSVLTAKSDKNNMSIEKGAINGGIQKKSERAKAPTVIIQVKDIDRTIEMIKANGGKIEVPKDGMPGMGFYAQFDDPEGNRIGLFQMAK